MKHPAITSLLLALLLGAAPLCAEETTLPEPDGAEAPAPKKRSDAPRVVHPKIGTEASSPDGAVSLRLVDKRQNYGGGADTRCAAIKSPKSVNINPSQTKYYVNSLEGGETLVFDARTHRLLKTISHRITAAHDSLWASPSQFYPFTHYKKSNHFLGKPVESTFSHGGRYLWVPYYRRSYDINAQDPSACAVIDTEKDEIVRLFETGPLPKMITTSPDGRYVAISHWGNNTVGLLDISSPDPRQWHHDRMFVVDYVLPLNYSLTQSVDRDSGSGYALRGTTFTPDGRYLLVGCMGGAGGIAVIDVEQGKYLGRVLGMMGNVRHLLLHDGYIYLSVNTAGYVQRARLDDFLAVIPQLNGKTARFTAWESAKVGAGARTIEISPSGRYVFAACNTASQLCVVDTKTMRQVLSIEADSFPVGLDISDDGRYVYLTSQGRLSAPGGGNCIDIFEVTYAEPEPEGLSFTPPPYGRQESPAAEEPRQKEQPEEQTESVAAPWIIAGVGAGLAAVGGGAWLLALKKRRKG